MKIRSYEDIKAIDKELAGLFLRPDEAVNWIYAVENGIKDWIGNHNKQFWEVVRHVSEQHGILGIQKKDNTIWLKREDFAKVLLKFCPNAVEKGETVSKLKSSMEHYQFATKLKTFDKLFDGHVARQHVKDVEDLLDSKPVIEVLEEIHKPTLEDLLEVYLRREIDEQGTNGFPRSIVCIRPQYEEVSPAISIETYKSQQLLEKHLPSHVEAYEFIDDELQENTLNAFIGKYSDTNMKLFIVSPCGLHPNVMSKAKKKNIGFVRLNPNSQMTSENYILPRSIEDHTKQQYDFDVLKGVKTMTTPLLIMDGSMVTSSLTDVLSERGIAVKRHRLLNIPYLPENEIEMRVNAMTEKDVEIRLQNLKHFTLTDFDISLDPFTYADAYGLSYETEDMEGNFQLGLLDVETNHVSLNSKSLDNLNRFRFTMAHELGHYILHSPLFKKQGVVTVGDTNDTLIGEKDSRKLEYQANKFAAYLLMPEKLVCESYKICHNFFPQHIYGDRLQPLYYNPKQPETWNSYTFVVGKMAELLGVSKEAMRIRLQSLGLLIMPD